MEPDYHYGTLASSATAAPIVARPFKCWGRGLPSVQLEESPVVEFLKDKRQLDPDYRGRRAPRGKGRGRPLPMDERFRSSSDDGTSHVAAYWRDQKGLVPPTLDTLETTKSAPGKSRETAAASSEAPSSPQAGRGIPDSWKMHSAQLVKPRREELRAGLTPPKHIDSSASGGQPETSQSQPCQPGSHAGDATKGAAASSGGHGRTTQRTARAPATRGRHTSRCTFDPSEYRHPMELDAWRDSWSRTRQPGSGSEPSEEEEDEEYNDEEDGDKKYDEEFGDKDEPHPCRSLDELLIKDFATISASESSTEVYYPTRRQSPTVHSTPPPAVEAFAAVSQKVEIRGLPYNATKEYVYDVAASYISVDDVDLFQADHGIWAQILLAEPCPVAWIQFCLQRAFSCEGAPNATVLTMEPSTLDNKA